MSAVSQATRSTAVVDGGETVEEFIAHVLHRAHCAAQVSGAPDEARMILALARLFAEELAAISEGFDSHRFIHAATHEPT